MHDTATLLARLEQLHRDLAAIAAGTAPTPGDLAAAPLLDAWRMEWRAVPCLVGIAAGHPRLRDGSITTSEVWALSRTGKWARTFSRWYQLGDERPGRNA